MKKKKPWLSFFVIALALLVVLSFVAISHLLMKSGKEIHSASIDISVSNNDGNNGSVSDKTEGVVSESVNPESEESKPESEESKSEPEESKPEVELFGGKGEVYHKEIQVFYSEYDDDGAITVKSDYGDKVVAPGTENQYDIYVRNVGKVPISYVLEAQSFLTVTVDGKQTEIPIEASFSAPDKGYLLGSKDELEPLARLSGVNDSSCLSPACQAKYTLTWSWPFDGNDIFDTVLGDLAAEGEDLTVKVTFDVTASYQPNAAGGSPITGDSSNIGLWGALFIISTFMMIILLFWRKRENDE